MTNNQYYKTLLSSSSHKPRHCTNLSVIFGQIAKCRIRKRNRSAIVLRLSDVISEKRFRRPWQNYCKLRCEMFANLNSLYRNSMEGRAVRWRSQNKIFNLNSSLIPAKRRRGHSLTACNAAPPASGPQNGRTTEKRKKRKEKEKNGVFSGHYTTSLPAVYRPNGHARTATPERRPLERRMLVPIRLYRAESWYKVAIGWDGR